MSDVLASILIVDDQLDNLRVLSKLLSHQGYDVRAARSGKIALETTKLDPPDLILLDIKLPDMSGYEVCRQLQAIQEIQDIPVIFISALEETLDKVQAFQTGGSDYITKPFELDEVMARIRNQLTIQQQHHQLMQKTRLYIRRSRSVSGPKKKLS